MINTNISTHRSDLSDLRDDNSLDMNTNEESIYSREDEVGDTGSVSQISYGSSTAKPSTGVEKYQSPIHSNILNSLQNSMALNPIFVDVKNLSYWYKMRKLLSAKKHNAVITKYNTSSVKWEAYIYKYKLRESDMEMAPKKTLVGEYKSKWLAYKHGELALKERDENPVENKKIKSSSIVNTEKILSTHFKILIVSEKFQGLSYVERLKLVYEELLIKIGTTIKPYSTNTDEINASDQKYDISNISLSSLNNKPPSSSGKNRLTSQSSLTSLSSKQSRTTSISSINQTKRLNLVDCAPTNFKIGSIFGKNMCELELFRFLPSMNEVSMELMIDARTPSQWKPAIYAPLLSERIGKAHIGLSSLEILQAAKPKNIKNRVKKLSTVVDHSTTLPNIFHNNNNSDYISKSEKSGLTLSDTLGMDPSVSGIKYKKLGGIYGHFFNDLSNDVKEMVMKKYKDNKSLIQLESTLIVDQSDNNKKSKNEPHSFMKTKLFNAQHLAEYDKGTGSEAEMMDEINISNHRMERIVIRLQRLRRITLIHRLMKFIWRRNYAIITIQRVVRGWFGRLYASLFKKLRPIAASKIQRCYRFSKSRVYLKWWRYLVYRISRVLLPKIKLFIKNCFLSWIKKRNDKAIKIQSIIRVRIAKSKYYQKLEYLGKVIKAAKIICRAWVNYNLNRKFKQLMDKHRLELNTQKRGKYIITRNELIRDIEEMHADINVIEKVRERIKTRIKELDTYLSEATV
eukprot:gene13030-17462_t